MRATHLKLGVLIKANQRIERYRYTANGYNLLRYAANKAVAADLNRVMPKRGHVWMGFLIPFRRIPVAVKGKLGHFDAIVVSDMCYQTRMMSHGGRYLRG